MTCDVKLYRKRQILAELESGCAEPAVLTVNSGGVEVTVAPQVEPDVQMNERDVARISLSRLQSIPGEITGSAKFSAEFKGTGAANTPNPLGKYLEACSMERRLVQKIGIDNLVGASAHEVPVYSVITCVLKPTATAIVAVPMDQQTYGTLFYILTGAVGFADTDLLVITKPDGDILTTAANTAEVIHGEAFSPITVNQKTITIRSEEDGYKKEIYSAMGTATFSAESSGIAKLEFDFKGVISKGYIRTATIAVSRAQGLVFVGATSGARGAFIRSVVGAGTAQEIHFQLLTPTVPFDILGESIETVEAVAIGTIAAGANINGGFGDFDMTADVVFPTTVPPILQDARLKLVDATDPTKSFSPVFSTVGFDLGNEVSVRKDGNSFNGLKTARVTGRKPMASADPEMMSQESFDIFNKWFNGEPASMQFQVGKGGDNNSLFFYGKRAQFTGNGDGDRDGVAVISSEMELVTTAGGGDDEYLIVLF